MSNAIRNFHIPLAEDLYAGLRREAERQGRRATELAREAIEAMLNARRRSLLDESIAQYASARAGSADDLDAAMEHASIEHWLSDADDHEAR